MNVWFRRVAVLLLAVMRTSAATFSLQGTNLTVTSASLQVSFSGADVVGITNRITGEQYLRNPSPNAQLNLTLVQAPSQALTASGSWVLDQAGTTAALSFSDSNRTVTIAVKADPTTQEIVIDLDGRAKQGGVERLMWGVSGFDLAAGKFIVPAAGGVSLTTASFAAASSYSFGTSNPLPHWEAPLSLFQAAQGGVAIYSTDMQALFKDLNLTLYQEQFVNELFEVEAPGPWNSAVEAGPVEWRLAAYQGEWQSGARIYREWHNAAMPPVPLTGARAWANNIRAVVKFGGGRPYVPSVLDPLAKAVDPSKTLLYLVNWRQASYDVNYPDYTPDLSVAALVAHAHQLGFHVMLHTDMIGVSSLNSDWAAMQQFQARDPLNLQPQGWNWNLPASTPVRYGYINPASSAYRTLFVGRLQNAVQSLAADALHLDIAGWPINDGNGLIEGLNYNQGAAQLHRDLLAAFPGVVLGTEGTNDTISPFGSFVQQINWRAPFNSAATPPLPISAYVLANVQPSGHLGQPNPVDGGFLDFLEQYEGQNVLPTFLFNQGSVDLSPPDFARYLRLIKAFQQYDLAPAWDTPWNGDIMQYSGSNGAAAALTDTGTIIQFSLNQSGTSSTVYQRVHGSNQAASPPWVPNWPAYNATQTIGLDPAYQFWFDGAANDVVLPHLTNLPAGVKLGLAAGTLITPQFSYFQLSPPASTTFDFFANLSGGNTGVTYNGADFPLANGATANAQNMIVGGVSRQAVFMQPPFTAQRGGEVFVEYSVSVPSVPAAALQFAVGILDSAIGQRQGPMTFKVDIDGAVLWQQDVSTGGWQGGSIDLAPFLGQTVKLRFVSNPGPSGNPNFGWGGFSALQIAISRDNTIDGINLAVPAGLAATNVVSTGGSVSVSGATATIDGLPPQGTVFVFTGQPTPVSAGQSLITLPFTESQSGAGQLAGPSTTIGGLGAIGSTTAGGVTKQQTLYAFSPSDGQSILSWYLQLPPSPLALSFSAAYWDGFVPFAQGFLMSIRVNGTPLWQHVVKAPAAWEYGSVDLSAWAGQTVVLELITDSQGNNTADFTSWAELAFSAPAVSMVTVLLPSASFASSGASNPLSAASTASLRTAVMRTLMETAPRPRAWGRI